MIALVEVVPLAREHVPSVRAILTDAFPGLSAKVIETSLEDCFQGEVDGLRRGFVATVEGAPAGTVQVERKPMGIYLEGLAVAPQWRGCRIASALIGHGERFVAMEMLSGAPGALWLKDEVERRSGESFYAQFGYSQHHAPTPGCAGLMKKRLNGPSLV